MKVYCVMFPDAYHHDMLAVFATEALAQQWINEGSYEWFLGSKAKDELEIWEQDVRTDTKQ